MNMRLFIKDRGPKLCITIGAYLIMLIFFTAFHTKLEQIMIISIIYVLAAASGLVWEYARRNRFYTNMIENVKKLDKKYLLFEMLEKPQFYEGELMYEALREASKSMCEQVAGYRREASEFREYIELWVHEVKLPVASLLLMCHNQPHMDETYIEQLRRIDDYIENVLYYARSENAEKDYLIKEVSLKRTFADIAVKNREELQQRKITLKTENLDKLVMTDGKWLAYILGQLMGNSMKYVSNERESELYIYAKEDANQVTLCFRDNGIGIPQSDLPYIFEKSFTGENGRTHAQSTGMGLYIVKTLCDKLGHKIEAHSRQGEYTEFKITFAKNDFYIINETKEK